MNETLKRIRPGPVRGKRVKIASRGTTLAVLRELDRLFPSVSLSRGSQAGSLRFSCDVIRRRDKQVKSSLENDGEL